MITAEEDWNQMNSGRLSTAMETEKSQESSSKKMLIESKDSSPRPNRTSIVFNILNEEEMQGPEEEMTEELIYLWAENNDEQYLKFYDLSFLEALNSKRVKGILQLLIGL